MLSEEERRELRELAHSFSLRDEFRTLKRASHHPRSLPVDLDRYIEFLTAMSRFAPVSPREVRPYRNVLL